MEANKVLVHDDDCGEVLTGDGFCPKCKFYPDMQSTAFRSRPCSLRAAVEVAAELDPSCDRVLGAALVTEDRLAFVKELRAFALSVKIDLERLAIENVANWLEHEIVKRGRRYPVVQNGRIAFLSFTEKEKSK